MASKSQRANDLTIGNIHEASLRPLGIKDLGPKLRFLQEVLQLLLFRLLHRRLVASAGQFTKRCPGFVRIFAKKKCDRISLLKLIIVP